MESYIHTQAEILRDEALIGAVVDRLDLEHAPEFKDAPGLADRFQRVIAKRPSASASTRPRVLRTVIGRLTIRPVGQTHIIQILFDSADPKLAANVVNALADEFIQRDLAERGRGTELMRKWLRGQLGELKGRLEGSERELQDYAKRAGLLFTQDKDNVAEAGLLRLQQELTQVRAERVAKQSQYEIASATRPEFLSQAFNSGVLRDYEVKLTELKREMAELGSVLTPSNYKIRRLQAQIAALEGAEKTELDSLQERILNEFKTAQNREAKIAANYERQSKNVADQASQSIHYNTLKREVETARDLHSAMSQQYQIAGLSSAVQSTNIRVIGPAEVPAEPYKPNPALAAAAGTTFGLLVGVLLIAFKESRDETVRSSEEGGTLLGVEVIGTIPSAGFVTNAWPAILISSRRARRLELATWENKSSPLAESFREMGATLQFRMQRERKLRALVITSPGPEDGKTTVVANLGAALAQIGNRVLLIDGDMRRPTLHEIFPAGNEHGLSTLLAGRGPMDAAGIEKLIHGTDIPGLWVLYSGPDEPDIQNCLHRGTLTELLRRTRPTFDAVLIDTPPLLAVADARLLARAADGVILVVRAGWTTRQTIAAATKRLRSDGIPIIGGILNDCDPQPEHCYYSRYMTMPGRPAGGRRRAGRIARNFSIFTEG